MSRSPEKPSSASPRPAKAPPVEAMVIFAHVVESQSFSRAAETLSLSKSAVSKAIAQLETHLGTRLLHRTTRSLKLTEAGERFHAHCARILVEAEEAELAVGRLDGRPRGRLRVSAPHALGRRFVLPVILELLAKYEGLEVDLSLDDAHVDLVKSGVDVAVRVGRLVDSSLVARRLAPARAFLVASPDYLAKHGVPATPEDLAHHRYILYSNTARPDQLVLERGDERVTVKLRGPLACNSGDTILEAILAGVGLGLLPEFIGTDAFCTGRLQVVLPDWQLPITAIHAVYPQAGPVPPAVRHFVDALATFATELIEAAHGEPFALALERLSRSSSPAPGALATPAQCPDSTQRAMSVSGKAGAQKSVSRLTRDQAESAGPKRSGRGSAQAAARTPPNHKRV